MRKLHHPEVAELDLASVLYALGDPVRLEIVKNLAGIGSAKNLAKSTDQRSCKFVCTRLSLSKSTLSHHFKILRESGLIRCEKQGTQYVNHLREQDLNKRFPGLLKSVLKSSDN